MSIGYDPVAFATCATAFTSKFLNYVYLRVRVIDDNGDSIDAATVNVDDNDYTTGADGLINRVQLASGTYTVAISKSGYIPRTIVYVMDRWREEIEMLESYEAVEAAIAYDITEDALTGDITEDALTGDITEDALTGDTAEDALTGILAEDALTGEIED